MVQTGFDRVPERVAVIGSSAFGTVAALARAGVRVSVTEDDPFARQRLKDMLSRLAPDVAANICVLQALKQEDEAQIVLAASVPPSNVTQAVSLDWTAGSDSALVMTHVPGLQPLLEILGPRANAAALGVGAALGAKLVPQQTGHVPVSQRLLALLSSEIEEIAMSGPSPAEIDTTLVQAGFFIGPFEAQDLTGLDVSLHSRRAVLAQYPSGPELTLHARAVAEGRLGQKVGVGWYRYPGGGGLVEDPLIEDMAFEEAHFEGVERRHIEPDEITSRVFGAVRSAAQQMLADGWVSEDEMATIAHLALGFPGRVV